VAQRGRIQSGHNPSRIKVVICMSDDIKGEKLRLLYSFASLMPPEPNLMFLTGLLAGAIDRLHFVRDLTGAPIAIRLAAGRARIWPAPGLEIKLRDVTVPDPMTLGSVLAGTEDPICVQLVLSGHHESEEFQRLVVDSYADVAAGRDANVKSKEERIEELKVQVDRALDIYSECLQQLRSGEDPGERKVQLKFFLQMAQKELEECSREMRELERELEIEKLESGK